MRGYKSIFVSSKHKIKCSLTFALVGGGHFGPPLWFFEDNSKTKRSSVTLGSYRSIFKIQTAFVSPQHDPHF